MERSKAIPNRDGWRCAVCPGIQPNTHRFCPLCGRAAPPGSSTSSVASPGHAIVLDETRLELQADEVRVLWAALDELRVLDEEGGYPSDADSPAERARVLREDGGR